MTLPGAEEVAQDAFVRAFLHLDAYDERRPFYPWLSVITVRLAQNWLVRRARVAGREGADRRAARRPETEGILGGLWAFIGAVLVAVVVVQRWLAAGFASELVSSRIGDGGLVLVPVDGWTLLVLCAGLALYLLGLFAPLRRGRV